MVKVKPHLSANGHALLPDNTNSAFVMFTQNDSDACAIHCIKSKSLRQWNGGGLAYVYRHSALQKF